LTVAFGRRASPPALRGRATSSVSGQTASRGRGNRAAGWPARALDSFRGLLCSRVFMTSVSPPSAAGGWSAEVGRRTYSISPRRLLECSRSGRAFGPGLWTHSRPPSSSSTGMLGHAGGSAAKPGWRQAQHAKPPPGGSRATDAPTISGAMPGGEPAVAEARGSGHAVTAPKRANGGRGNRRRPTKQPGGAPARLPFSAQARTLASSISLAHERRV